MRKRRLRPTFGLVRILSPGVLSGGSNKRPLRTGITPVRTCDYPSAQWSYLSTDGSQSKWEEPVYRVRKSGWQTLSQVIYHMESDSIRCACGAFHDLSRGTLLVLIWYLMIFQKQTKQRLHWAECDILERKRVPKNNSHPIFVRKLNHHSKKIETCTVFHFWIEKTMTTIKAKRENLFMRIARFYETFARRLAYILFVNSLYNRELFCIFEY